MARQKTPLTKIELLKKKINAAYRRDKNWLIYLHECPEGWFDVVERLHYDLLTIAPNYQINQIKEKFGGLRYYANPGEVSEEVANAFYERIGKAEQECDSICQNCGNPGVGHYDGWHFTLCEDCKAKLISERENKCQSH